MLQAVGRTLEDHGTSCSNNASPGPISHRSELNPVELRDALLDIYNLLEDYAPSWYTQEYKQKAEAALHLGKV